MVVKKKADPSETPVSDPDLITKREAMELLGKKSKRTIEGYQTAGRLEAIPPEGPGQPNRYRRADVLRLKEELEREAVERQQLALTTTRAIPAPGLARSQQTALAQTEAVGMVFAEPFSQLAAQIAGAIQSSRAPVIAQLSGKLVLTVRELSEFVHLSRDFIRSEVRAGHLPSIGTKHKALVLASDVEPWLQDLKARRRPIDSEKGEPPVMAARPSPPAAR
jgi:hypothetical protein